MGEDFEGRVVRRQLNHVQHNIKAPKGGAGIIESVMGILQQMGDSTILSAS